MAESTASHGVWFFSKPVWFMFSKLSHKDPFSPLYLVLINPDSADPLITGLYYRMCVNTETQHLCQRQTRSYVYSLQSSDYQFSLTNTAMPGWDVQSFLSKSSQWERKWHSAAFNPDKGESVARIKTRKCISRFKKTFLSPCFISSFIFTANNIWMVASVIFCAL